MSAVARRYATAAVEAATEAGGDDAVQKLARGLHDFAEAYQASADLREVLNNPKLSDQREPVLQAILAKLGASELVSNVIRLLVQNDRIDVLQDAVREVEELADERAGRLRADVESAISLTPDQQTRIGKALEKRFGRPVVLSVTVDPEVLGGLVCRVGDVTLDSSLRRQLALLRERLGATR